MKTHEQFVKEISCISPNIIIKGKYVKSTERIKVKCNICGYEWEPKAYSLTQGKGCPHCSAIRGTLNNTGKTGLKTNEKFIKEMFIKHPEIEVFNSYVNGHTKVKCKCKICSHQWEAMPYALLQGHGCPHCAKSGTSFMEQFILISFRRVLGNIEVLSRDKQLIGMELDIYIPSLKLAIEPGNWFLHKKSIERDLKKRKICESKGITLITIYDKFPIDGTMPFDNNCFVFKEDLNNSNHEIIRNLVLRLFKIADINRIDKNINWKSIEVEAYNNAKAKTHEKFIEEMHRVHPNIDIIDKYENSNKPILVNCKKCGYQWYAVPSRLLSGDGCKKCGTIKSHKKFIKSQKEFENEVNKVNPDIVIIGEYSGRHNKIRAKCKVCGYEWEPIASSLL